MQRDIVYRNIAATHIACDTEGMLHGEISHGNFIIFDAFLGRFWLFSASDCVIILDLRFEKGLWSYIWCGLRDFLFDFLRKKNFFFEKKLYLWRT